MTCRSCAAEIADKAIVCYRCGAPTAAEPPAPRAAPRRSGARLWLIALGLVTLAVVVWVVFDRLLLTRGSPAP